MRPAIRPRMEAVVVTHHLGLVSPHPGRLRHHPGAMSHHPVPVRFHPGVVSEHPGVVRYQAGGIRRHPGVVRECPGVMRVQAGLVGCHPGAVGCHPGAVGCHPGAVGCHPGAVCHHPGAMSVRPGLVCHHPGAMRGHPGGVGCQTDRFWPLPQVPRSLPQADSHPRKLPTTPMWQPSQLTVLPRVVTIHRRSFQDEGFGTPWQIADQKLKTLDGELFLVLAVRGIRVTRTFRSIRYGVAGCTPGLQWD